MASHRRPKKPGKARVGVFTAAAATAVVLVPDLARADPAPGGAAAERRVNDLYHEAETLTEEYNGLHEKQQRLRRDAAAAQERVVAGQGELVALHESIGRIAGAQYRDGGIDPVLNLLLAQDGGDHLGRAALFDRLSDQQVQNLHTLRGRTRLLDTERAEATGALADLERTRARLAEKKAQIEAKLREARRVLNTLSEAERRRVLGEDGHGNAAARGPGEHPAVASEAVGGRAAAALAAARRALGKPYRWGATGPNAFDCSGLTGWAWRQAGVSLPRTSQAQARAGRPVPVGQIKPGDLVLYYGAMTHIGMYAGNGQIIHAPRTGSTVRYAPLNSMPVSKVVRVS